MTGKVYQFTTKENHAASLKKTINAYCPVTIDRLFLEWCFQNVLTSVTYIRSTSLKTRHSKV